MNVKHYRFNLKQLAQVLRGETRVRNLPGDAELTGVHIVGDDIAVRAHSAQFPPVATGEFPPEVLAITEGRDL